MSEIEIVRADLRSAAHQSAVLEMLNAYAMDPMGDEQPLGEYAREHLIDGLRNHPTTLIFFASRKTDLGSAEPVGIVISFRGFSTFAAKPLINLHDVYVDSSVRGQGVGVRLLRAVEEEGLETGCCKLTLEVQEHNTQARRVYEQYGFAQATYAKDAGGALFMSKPLSPP